MKTIGVGITAALINGNIIDLRSRLFISTKIFDLEIVKITAKYGIFEKNTSRPYDSSSI